MKQAPVALLLLFLVAAADAAPRALLQAKQTKANRCKDGNGCQANRLIVRFQFAEAGGPPAGAGPPESVPGVGLRKVSNLGGSGRVALYKYAGAADPVDKAAQVAARPDVLYAEPDYMRSANIMPDDGSRQWPWNVISAPAAWDVISSASDVTVGVIDTGIQTSHPDLDGKIDSTKLWCTIDKCTSVEDGNGHGTHCAGTVGAETNNAGVAGTAWGVRLAVCKFLSDSGSGYTSDAVQCIDSMRNAGVQITSNSWGGGGYSQALYDSIAAVCNSGGLFIAAAGNSAADTDGGAHYPSTYDLPCIMSIASTTSTDSLSSFSNYGAKTVDMGAPGSSILSTWPTTLASSGEKTISGTSMATPHVAGAAALVWSASGKSLSGTQIKQLIMDNTDPLNALNGKTVSGGRLNLYKAVVAASGGAPSTPPSPSPAPPSPAPPSPPPPDATATISCSATFNDKTSYRGKSATYSSGAVDVISTVCQDWKPMDLAGKAESLQVACSCSGADCPADTSLAPVVRVYDRNGNLRVTAETACLGASCTKNVNGFGTANNSNYAMRLCFGGAT